MTLIMDYKILHDKFPGSENEDWWRYQSQLEMLYQQYTIDLKLY